MEDYIIIENDGYPLTFADATIVVYGDKQEALDDLGGDDMGISVLRYGGRNKGFQDVTVFKPCSNEIHGTFTYNFRLEEDFQKCLKSFIKRYPFKV